MNVLRSFAIAALLSLLIAPDVQAQSPITDAVFSAVEKRIIREHFGKPADAQAVEDTSAPKWAEKDDPRDAKDKGNKDKGNKDKGDKSQGLPPGLAKRDALPPGLARQLKEKGRLPAGIAKRDLPEDLLTQLPPRPDSQEVTQIEGDVVLIDKATGIILDVLNDVANGAGVPVPSTNPNGTLVPPSPQDEGVEENMLDVILKGVFGGRSQ